MGSPLRFPLCVIAISCLIGAALACERRTGDDRAPSEERLAPASDEGSALTALMDTHYEIAIRAHEALLHAELEDFRSQLALLAKQELPSESPREWLPLYEALQAAASAGTEARDIDSAASAFAPVVLACGNCHSTLGEGPAYRDSTPSAGSNALQNAMLDHEWAAERLWEGVTGPSDNAWQRGADALAATDIFGDQGEAVLISEFVRERDRHLHELAESAKIASALDERADLYARMLSTCGECHQAIRVLFEDPQ